MKPGKQYVAVNGPHEGLRVRVDRINDLSVLVRIVGGGEARRRSLRGKAWRIAHDVFKMQYEEA